MTFNVFSRRHRTPYLRKVFLVIKLSVILLFTTIQLSAADAWKKIPKDPGIITGTVRNENGEPLAGVTVTVKGSNIAVKSDDKGFFSIKPPGQAGTLIFSSVGYIRQEINFPDARLVNVILKEDVFKLSEVVVQGYGNIRRKDVTGSVGSVNMKEAEKAPVTNFVDALAGRVAGMQVSSNEGQPGSIANITIRGANSLTQSNEPLYVIDGFPLENASVNSLNPLDIESVDVLKDASATAIYGARGANGVVVITTKKGKPGPPVVGFNIYAGTQSNPKTLKLLNAYEYAKLQIETSSSNTSRYINSEHSTLESYLNSPSLDLQDQLFRTGHINNYDISIRGGNAATRYAISGNYLTQDGIIITSGFKRYQGRINLEQKINDKIKAGIVSNYGYSVASGTPISNPGVATGLTSSNNSAGILYSVWTYRPTTGYDGGIDTLTDQLFDPAALSGDPRINPIIDMKNQIRKTLNNTLFTNAYVEYSIIPTLVFKSTGGITLTNTEIDAFYNSKTYYGRDTIPGRSALGNGVSGSIFYNKSTVWSNENTLTYTKQLNQSNRITVLGGVTFLKTTISNRGFAATHIPKDNESFGLDALSLAPSLWSATGASYNVTASNSSVSTQQSYLARVNYAFANRYLVTASFRADGSSKFSPGNKWGYFSSGALAWRLSEENFIKKIKAISDAKIRLGYGETGNNRVADFAYMPQLLFASGSSFTGYTYNNLAGGSGVVIGSIGNKDLTWETTSMTNAGLDLGFFKQRLQFTFDWYKKVTDHLLLNANVPLTTGVASAIKNVGKMQNTGFEFSFTTVNIANKRFSWSTSFNISFNRNKLLALTEGATFLTLPAQTIIGVGINNTYNSLSPYISIIGQPVGQMYGVIFDGLYQYADFDVLPNGTYKLKAGIPYYGSAATPKPGWARYRDLNNDGIIDQKDNTIIGRGLPVHTGGFTNNFSYANFDLNIFFQWSYGNDLINANRLVLEAPADVYPSYVNQLATMVNRWSPKNQNSNIPVGIGASYAGYNSNVVEDGSYLRLKTVSFGYTFPPKWLSSAKIKSLRLYASAQNIFTWTNYTGSDPEVSTRNTVQSPGFDYMAYPNPKTLAAGINVTF